MEARKEDIMSKKELSSLGEYLQAARATSGLSQRQAALKGGMHHSFLARLESGEVKGPDPALLQQYCDAIGADAGTALSYLGVKPILPEPRMYFRKAYGVDEVDAEAIAQLIAEFQAKKKGGEK